MYVSINGAVSVLSVINTEYPAISITSLCKLSGIDVELDTIT